jgi:methylmalonyl-CoA/ethylmalonyl-CoA epimerase
MSPETTAAAVQIGEIGQVALTVRDLARAKQFYRDVLGMAFLFDAGTLAFFQCGAVRLMLGLAEKPVTPAGTILYFKMDDVRAAHAALLAQGVTFLQEPHLVAKMPDHDVWMAFIEDTEGNTLGLMSELARA